MKRNELYRQCRLVKKVRGGEAVQTSYLPAEFAKEGRIVKVREDDGGWDDGWVIRSLGGSLTEDQLADLEGQARLCNEGVTPGPRPRPGRMVM